jgi:hypothetical protein
MSGKTLNPASRLKSVKDPFHLLSCTMMYICLSKDVFVFSSCSAGCISVILLPYNCSPGCAYHVIYPIANLQL